MIEAPILAYLIETTNGRMKFDGPDRVLEYGVEADYFEIWERLPGSQGESFAIRMSDDPLSPLPCPGAYVMVVRLRSEKLPVAHNLATFVEGKNGQNLRETLDFEISFGRWDGRNSEGKIGLSTLPWKQGTPFLNFGF